MTCPKADQHATTTHVTLDKSGAWAHLRKTLTHAEAQRIEVAEMAANYNPEGKYQLALATVISLLSSAPKAWRDEHFDTTVNGLRYYLDDYETNHELALKRPEVREAMAKASIEAWSVRAEVFFVESSTGEAWPLADGIHCHVIERRALRAWNDWNAELAERLKDDGADSD